MRDLVALVHRNLAIHSDVKIDIKLQAHFASAAFFNVDDTWDGARNIANRLDGVMRRESFAHAFNGRTDSGGQDLDWNNRGRNRLRAPVSIGMGSLRRAGGNFQPAPNDKRVRDVEPGFNAIGNENIGVTEPATEN